MRGRGHLDPGVAQRGHRRGQLCAQLGHRQVRDGGPRFDQGGAGEGDDLGRLGLRPGRVRVHEPLHELRLDVDGGQGVAEDVVQVQGQPLALLGQSQVTVGLPVLLVAARGPAHQDDDHRRQDDRHDQPAAVRHRCEQTHRGQAEGDEQGRDRHAQPHRVREHPHRGQVRHGSDDARSHPRGQQSQAGQQGQRVADRVEPPRGLAPGKRQGAQRAGHDERAQVDRDECGGAGRHEQGRARVVGRQPPHDDGRGGTEEEHQPHAGEQQGRRPGLTRQPVRVPVLDAQRVVAGQRLPVGAGQERCGSAVVAGAHARAVRRREASRQTTANTTAHTVRDATGCHSGVCSGVIGWSRFSWAPWLCGHRVSSAAP